MAKHSKRDKYTGTLEAIQAKHAIAMESRRIWEADAKDMEKCAQCWNVNALRHRLALSIDSTHDARTDARQAIRI
jgi:hypothetical protein